VPQAQGDRRILRASDADRDETVELLRRHGGEGRLTLDELRERIEAALEAKTLGDLDNLLADLPREHVLPATPVTTPPAPFRPWRSPSVIASAMRLVVLDLFASAVWAVTSAGHSAFWPIWVILFSVVRLAQRCVRSYEREQRARRRAARPRTPPPGLTR
jgi:hypothetical protein